MSKMKHMNTIKHIAPEPGRSKPRNSYNGFVREYLIVLKCSCGFYKEQTVYCKKEPERAKGWLCDSCRKERNEQRKLFGKDKNFLTALDRI